jgi:hypothetical protein
MDWEEPGSCWIDWVCGYRHGFWGFDAVGWTRAMMSKSKSKYGGLSTTAAKSAAFGRDDEFV